MKDIIILVLAIALVVLMQVMRLLIKIRRDADKLTTELYRDLGIERERKGKLLKELREARGQQRGEYGKQRREYGKQRGEYGKQHSPSATPSAPTTNITWRVKP